MSDNIKVVVKVRPLISREVDDKLFYQWRINNNTLYQIDQNGKDAGPSFTFDKVYDTKTKTDDVYNDIAKPIVEAATAGFNGTIFAYGQTSSGKTYTMTGTDEAPGLIPLAVLNLFDIIKTIPDRDFLVRVSYVEIYNESLIDLLDIKNPVTIKESFHGVKVNTTEKPTVSPEEVLELMRQGKANRQTGSTNMNEESSRSHSIFQITIESREHIEGEQEVGSVNVSQLNLVDLAGSERAGQTGATGLRFKEGTHINKSLSTLALVIKQLSENQNKHVNYRDSKLTRILQNSLGGNAKTSIICAVTPAAVEETISTLQFANRAKAIKNTPAVNLVATDATMIQSLTKQLSSLKTQLECKKHVEQDNYNLQRQIANLQRLILNSFGNSRNTDIISGARRKLQQPRRVTISTLHPIEEDPLPAVPKFCTPSLKYNPLSLGVPEHVPLQGARSLSSVSEERAITPPAREFPDEVIEIDSDEDTASDIQPCSPYHSCYQSKTPPCILRKTAKQAEKNLKDIVELTEREKIYMPNVIELMEKLEDKSLVIAKLEDDISNLNSISKEKDKELGTLKSKIADAEEEIKNIALVKEKLEETCKEYSTKLTDWEVSYETLKKKSRSREEELLSLLQEHENRKKRSIAKLSSKAIENELKNFMDLSRDISLVNSSIENSIIETEAKPTEPDLKEQLTMRDQTILQLEANLHAQKLKIDNLENVNDKIQGMLTSLNEKISLLVDENAILKTAVDSLNSTVSNQKSHIDTANADIESYCSVIKEMRAKLANRDDAKETGDEDLEAMLANEEMFVANNENVKNIIQSLKKALETRDEELKKLKSDLDGDENLCLELEIHKNEIATLKKDVERLRSEATDNISIINTMVQEKNSMINVEKQLASKLTEIIEEKDSLEKAINSHTDEITKLKDSNNKLSLELNGKHEEILSIKEKNNLQIKDISQKVNKLELTVKNKEEIIENLKKEQSSTEAMIGKAKLGLCKIKNIITLLTGDVNEIPEFVDNLVDAFSSLGDNLTVVEDIARDIMKEKQDAFTMLEQRETELKSLKTTINDLGDRVDAFCDEYENLIQEHVEEKIMKRDELLNGAANVCDRLNNKINNLLYAIKITQNALVRAISEKKSELDESKIRHENVSKQLELESHRNKTHVQHIDNLTSSRFLTLKRILEKVTNLTSKFNIENSVSCQFDDDAENLYELVMLTIDKVDNYIAVLNTEHSKCDNVESVLGDAKNKILQLTDENLKLVQGIADLETDKAVLNDEIKRVQEDSKSLTKQLRDTSDLMNELHRELSAKSSEIETIENNTKTWRDKFFDLEVSMQDRIDVLETENVELKSKCSELELHELPKCDDNGDSLACGDRECYYRRRNNYIQANSPPSLVTICCHRIADAMDLNDDRSLTSSSSCTELSDSKLSTNKCQCKDLLADVEKLMDEKRKLNGTIERLQNENDNLMRERLDVQREVQLLSEHSCELQKRLLNHRTVLSTLTATTYAENKSLSSQIKFLQHHHNRFHHVCQKDIPAFKKQLQDLMALLKTEYLGRQNETFKRYSLPNALDASSLHSTFKNESAFDLLMLDTNVTLTTCDNTMTMVGHDQTCFDATHVVVTSEVACQTNEVTKSSLYPQTDSQLQENRYIEAIESIKSENHKLHDLVDEYSRNKSKVLVTTMSSPIKMPDCPDICKKCDKYISDIRLGEESHGKEIDALSKRLNDLESEKSDILEKYNNLSLEMLSSDALIKKINHLENEIQTKQNDIRTVTATLNKTNKTLSVLQEENNSLSNEVIDNISEIDILRGEQESLKEINRKLTEKCVHLEEELKRSEPEDRVESVCDRCTLKEETINNLQKRLLMSETHSKLDRSYSDADSSSRYNKICTLQNELHAGKEDCIELKEEVTTIKKHLEHSNLSMSQNMDLDESIVDSHVYSFNKDYGNTNQNKFVSSDVPQRQVTDVYAYDRTECLNYYCEKSGVDKNSFNTECKIVDIMKMLFVDFTTKHATEVENLVNRLKHFEEAKTDLQAQLNEVNGKQLTTQKDLKEKECYLQRFADVVSCVRQNITAIDRELGADDVVITFRDTFLKIIDTEFGFASSNIFEVVTDKLNKKHNEELEVNAAEIARLKESTQEMVSELSSVNENLLSLKSRLSDKESEFDLLQRQKDKMHEISKAVTIDLIKREKEFRDQLTHYYSRLLENNIIQNDIDLSLPLNASLDILFKNILNKFQNKDLEEEKLSIVSELEKLKTILQQKDDEIHSLRDNLKREVTEVERKLKTQISLHDDLNKIYAKKVEENEINSNTISKLTEEVNLLKENVLNKEKIIASLETRQSEAQAKELEHIKSLQNNQKELEELKAVNGIILKEKERCATELESAREMLARQKLEIDNMTSLIDSLKQSVHESTRVVESLNIKSDTLLEENNLLQKQLQEKCSNCARLEINIKTHEKTAAIQTKIINRLQTQKAEYDKSNSENEKQIEAVTEKCKSLEGECLKLATEKQTFKEEIEKLNALKHTMELRISELESVTHPRLSIDSASETARRRRQSIHDSKRMFAEDDEDHEKIEAVFKSCPKADDPFMEVDDDSSSRSTPARLSRGRDSLLSKHDQSDTGSEQSRPGSVAASRRRRQSAHDRSRSVAHAHPARAHAHAHESSHETSGSFDGEAAQLGRLPGGCREELEQLRRRCRELDEECDTCALYLRERDEQCARLKRDKTALENTIAKLREKLQTMTPYDTKNIKSTFKDATVNTEEDWTNLHSVVVDRMSYDAEVEKNKKLMRTIEELRFKKQDLKNTMAKMQKALEKTSNRDNQELESTKAELAKCKQEIEELKERNKELDDECETCAEYLREREQQCQKLKEAKAALEARLEEYQQSSVMQSVRKRRHTLHDRNRLAATHAATDATDATRDAATDTGDDLLSYQVERDECKIKLEDSKEIKRLKLVVDRLTEQKASLEQQLASTGSLYVATGSAIVQNQQLSDVMKENQKLKKMNAKLVTICKKRGKSMVDSNRENEDPSQQAVGK